MAAPRRAPSLPHSACSVPALRRPPSVEQATVRRRRAPCRPTRHTNPAGARIRGEGGEGREVRKEGRGGRGIPQGRTVRRRWRWTQRWAALHGAAAATGEHGEVAATNRGGGAGRTARGKRRRRRMWARRGGSDDGDGRRTTNGDEPGSTAAVVGVESIWGFFSPNRPSLCPSTPSLPCASLFAVCDISGHTAKSYHRATASA